MSEVWKMILGVAAAFVVVAMSSPFVLESPSKPKCQKRNRSDHVTGRCPVNITSVPDLVSGRYSEKIYIHVWLKADDFDKSPKIEIDSEHRSSRIYPFTKKRKRPNKKGAVRCPTGDVELKTTVAPFDLQELRNEQAKGVRVSYITASTTCNVRYIAKDPVPAFSLEVNQSSKSFTITVDAADYPVNARWCYQNGLACNENNFIQRRQSQSAVLRFPFLLPCVCVEVFYSFRDARRNRTCPFLPGLVDATDVWLSSTVTLYEKYVIWSSKCAASAFDISASLCWMLRRDLCVSTLQTRLRPAKVGQHLNYTTSKLDKHPLMCLQFSLGGSHHVNCSFHADTPSWEVYLSPGGQSVSLYLTSSTPATFSAQLCVLEERTCTPVGEIHSVATTEDTTDSKMKVPVNVVAQKPCVQVWRSFPPLVGRRILCPDYAHRRHGLYTVAMVMLVFVTVFVVTYLYRLTKSATTGWLCIQEPALLVCSSEQSAHISAVCALASILQGELSATVHMALWALRSQTRDGAPAGVADLGPLPWLYGQWEAVSKKQGKVLIVWSSEAKKTYERWKERRENGKKTERRRDSCSEAKVEHEKLQENMVEGSNPKGKRQKDCVQSPEDLQREPCTVIAPVFTAALACLEAALQKCKGQRVAFVYFQSFCHNRDIPKAFRGIPRYCLPQDFRGLLQELGAKPGPLNTGNFSYRCLPRLLFKIRSVWLARRLAQKLQALLPQTQGKTKPAQKQTLGKTQNGLKLPLTEDPGGAGTSGEREPLRRPPLGAEVISSRVSCV